LWGTESKFFLNIANYRKVKVKVKIHPITGYEGPEGE